MLRKYHIILLLLLIPTRILAEVSFLARVDKTSVNIGDRINLVYSINSNFSQFVAPNFKPFQILKGPEISKDGNNYNYSYILKAEQSGNVRIPPAKALIHGSNYSSNSIHINVVERPVPELDNSKQKPSTVDEIANSILDNYIYIKASFVDKKYVVGENLILEYLLYVHNDITLSEITEPSPPLFDSWWVDEQNIGELHYKNETIDGVPFRRAVLRKYILNGLSAADYFIPEFKLIIKAAIPYNNSFSDEDYYQKEMTCKSEAISVRIDALPQPPQGFSGAVGNFSVSSSLSRTEAALGEPFQLLVEISGNGNLKHIGLPKLNLPSGIKQIGEASVRDSIFVFNGIFGKRFFDISLKAETKGEFLLGQVTLPYFSPSASKYLFANAEPITINISNGIVNGITTPEESISYSQFFKTAGTVALALVAMIIIIILMIRMKKNRQTPNVVNTTPHFDLSNTKNLSDKDLINAISAEIYVFLENNYDISNNYSREMIANALLSNGITKSSIISLMNYLDKLDRLRFSNTSITIDESALKSTAYAMMNQIIQETKKV